LIEKYDDKRLIAAHRICHILELKQVNKEPANEVVELVNTFSNNVNALEALKIDVPLSDVIISQVVSQKLEPTTSKAWELKLNDTSFPPLNKFISFLENRREALQMLDPPKARGQLNKATQEKDERKSKIWHNTSTFISTSNINCKKCKGRHSLSMDASSLLV
jgi:hypothetical protein